MRGKPLTVVPNSSLITIEGIERKLIKPGNYEASFSHHETNATAFNGAPKVYLYFTLVDPGVMGIKLYKPFNVKKLTGKPGLNGKFTLGPRFDLTYLLCTLNPKMRLDRVSLCNLKEGTWRVRVRTVVKDYRQRALPPQLQYSVVDEILEREYPANL